VTRRSRGEYSSSTSKDDDGAASGGDEEVQSHDGPRWVALRPAILGWHTIHALGAPRFPAGGWDPSTAEIHHGE
jgi:hypothetical protein